MELSIYTVHHLKHEEVIIQSAPLYPSYVGQTDSIGVLFHIDLYAHHPLIIGKSGLYITGLDVNYLSKWWWKAWKYDPTQ